NAVEDILRSEPTIVAQSEEWRKASVMLRPRLAPILFSGQVQPACICLPSDECVQEKACQTRFSLIGASDTSLMYRQLDAQKIVDTANTLQSRISERFPSSGLSRLAAEVSAAPRETIERPPWIRNPHLPLPIAIYLLLAAIFGLFVATMASLELPKLKEFGEFIQVLEAGLSAMFFISAFVIFLFTWESRI